MNFIRTNELIDSFKNGTFREKDAIPYFIAESIFISLHSFFRADIPCCASLRIIESALSILIFIWGIKYAYRMNGGDSGKDFLSRFISIGWVITFRWWINTIIAVAIISSIYFAITKTNITEFKYLSLTLSVALNIVIFLNTGKTLKKIHEG